MDLAKILAAHEVWLKNAHKSLTSSEVDATTANLSQELQANRAAEIRDGIVALERQRAEVTNRIDAAIAERGKELDQLKTADPLKSANQLEGAYVSAGKVAKSRKKGPKKRTKSK